MYMDGNAAISSGDFYIGTNGAAFISFGTNDTERMRIDANGNVGIGVAPSDIFEIAVGNGRTIIDWSCFSNTVTDRTILYFRKSANDTIGTLTATADGEDLGDIIWRGVNNASAWDSAVQIKGEQEGATDANLGGRILFNTQPKGGALTERVRVSSGGGLFLTEIAAADTDIAGKGQLWVKNTTPCELWFTDDAGTDTQIV
jgi:hypothetical protein